MWSPIFKLALFSWAYEHTSNKSEFFLKNHFYGRLAGTSELKGQIESNLNVLEIQNSWTSPLTKYLTIRKKYLLYKDF